MGLNKKTEAAVAFLHCLARDPGNKGVEKSLAKVGRFFNLNIYSILYMSSVFPEDMHAPLPTLPTITTIESFLYPSGNPTLVITLNIKVTPKSQHFRKIFSTTGCRSLEEDPMVYL